MHRSYPGDHKPALDSGAGSPDYDWLIVGSGFGGGVAALRLAEKGYRNFLVCDGSTMLANPGVNPSLTTTAMSEHFMSQVPARDLAN